MARRSTACACLTISAFQLGDRVSIRYGSDFLMAGLAVNHHIGPSSRGSGCADFSHVADFRAGYNQYLAGSIRRSRDVCNPPSITLDSFPTLLLRDGRPVLEDDLHAEIAVRA